jgi:putative ABC transport system permease protein
MDQIISESTAPRRFTLFLLAAFAGLAIVLAAIGIYGVIANSVSQRTHEIGIRMALGAQRQDVMRLVVGQGARLVAAGIVIGIIGALALTRSLASFLYGVRPTDPVTFAGAVLLLGAVAILASYIPARRATKVDPMVALRYE